MKKLVLSTLALMFALSSSFAQRLSIYEEFSGENCGPCAALNPALWDLMSANPTKVILVKYQSPIPTAGPLYAQTKALTDSRISYYSVPFAPYGRLNGTVQGNGNISNLTQANIDDAFSAGSPFTILVTPTWSVTGDSITANIRVTANGDYAPANANLKLRVGLIETLEFDRAPGSNGEKVFHNVVREMYPNAAGQQMNNAWGAEDFQNFTIAARVPSFIDKTNGQRLVVWIQNDQDKTIPQATVTTALPSSFAKDAAISGLIASQKSIGCTGESINPTVTITNKGNTALTAATVFFKFGNAAWASLPWSGNLAPGASTNMNLSALTLPNVGGESVFADSIVIEGDMNRGNNSARSFILTVSTTPKAIPYFYDWETNLPSGWFFYDSDKSDQRWIRGFGQGLAFNLSSYMAWYKTFEYTPGSSSIMIVPTPVVSGQVSMDFQLAYATQTFDNTDKLEVVVSTDCGATWTPIWSKAGMELSSSGQLQNAQWLPDPNPGSNDWDMYTINLSNLTSGSLLGFRATAGGGANMFIDNIRIKSGLVSLKEELDQQSVSIFPNPAQASADLSFTLKQQSVVKINVFDASGRLVREVASREFGSGKQTITIETAQLESGLYTVEVTSQSESVKQKLMIAH